MDIVFTFTAVGHEAFGQKAVGQMAVDYWLKLPSNYDVFKKQKSKLVLSIRGM